MDFLLALVWFMFGFALAIDEGKVDAPQSRKKWFAPTFFLFAVLVSFLH